MFDVTAKRYGTLRLLAVLRVITAECDELLADGTAAVRLSLAGLRV